MDKLLFELGYGVLQGLLQNQQKMAREHCAVTEALNTVKIKKETNKRSVYE